MVYDFALEGWAPDNNASAECMWKLEIWGPELELLRAQSASEREWLVFYDSSQMWGLPGAAKFLGVHVARDRDHRSVRVEAREAPTEALAQRWLIASGAQPDALARKAGLPEPADEESRRIESHIRDSGVRYHVEAHHTDHQHQHTWALLRDTAPDVARPWVAQTERSVNRGTGGAYLIREERFTARSAALEWVRASEHRHHRAQAATSRCEHGGPSPTSPTATTASANTAHLGRART
ncbi:hypothetical protein [Streptomyces sp. SID3343]|uniref:hypothetical protein n=1 Tax=Streptomyces sp. SID3343 TaxID=2690260 RepID=UPI0013679D9D|nr:hypothetical protein [Streptomyces sp. SID3343]MYV97304.1 hypothetical protein [Streptomyces sp. SID3343]